MNDPALDPFFLQINLNIGDITIINGPGNGWNWGAGGSATGGNSGGIRGYRIWKKDYW